MFKINNCFYDTLTSIPSIIESTIKYECDTMIKSLIKDEDLIEAYNAYEQVDVTNLPIMFYKDEIVYTIKRSKLGYYQTLYIKYMHDLINRIFEPLDKT